MQSYFQISHRAYNLRFLGSHASTHAARWDTLCYISSTMQPVIAGLDETKNQPLRKRNTCDLPPGHEVGLYTTPTANCY